MSKKIITRQKTVPAGVDFLPQVDQTDVFDSQQLRRDSRREITSAS